jgi:hypothetical protein
MVPENIKETLARYVENRCPTGGFLRAVLSNDLTEACSRADTQNQKCIFDIVNYIYNNLPSVCWGSPKKVDKWLNDKE